MLAGTTTPAGMLTEKEHEMKRLGAVIVFMENISQEEADAVLSRLVEEGFIDSACSNLEIQEFDEEHGYPVFYIP